MKLVIKEPDLRDLQVMLERGSHKIMRVGRSSAGMDVYFIRAPEACSTTYAVPKYLRPLWGQQFYKEGK